jgi:hypothetical protein
VQIFFVLGRRRPDAARFGSRRAPRSPESKAMLRGKAVTSRVDRRGDRSTRGAGPRPEGSDISSRSPRRSFHSGGHPKPEGSDISSRSPRRSFHSGGHPQPEGSDISSRSPRRSFHSGGHPKPGGSDISSRSPRRSFHSGGQSGDAEDRVRRARVGKHAISRSLRRFSGGRFFPACGCGWPGSVCEKLRALSHVGECRGRVETSSYTSPPSLPGACLGARLLLSGKQHADPVGM